MVPFPRFIAIVRILTHVVFLFITSLRLVSHPVRLEAGMDDYIAKPITSEILDIMLKRWISEEPEGAAMSSQPEPPYAHADSHETSTA